MRIHVLYNYYLLLLCRFCTFTYSINTIQCVTVVTLFEKQNLELVQNFHSIHHIQTLLLFYCVVKIQSKKLNPTVD